MIVESQSGSAGLIVDGVNEVMTVTEDQLEPEAGSQDGYLNGIAKVDERLIVLLDAPGADRGARHLGTRQGCLTLRSALEVGQDLAGRVLAGRAGDAAARVCA